MLDARPRALAESKRESNHVEGRLFQGAHHPIELRRRLRQQPCIARPKNVGELDASNVQTTSAPKRTRNEVSGFFRIARQGSPRFTATTPEPEPTRSNKHTH